MTTKTYELRTEATSNFRAWRWMVPAEFQPVHMGGFKQRIALLVSFRRAWDYRKPSAKGKLKWCVRLIGQDSHIIVWIAWRSDSREWSRQHRGRIEGLFRTPLEIVRSANGPWITTA